MSRSAEEQDRAKGHGRWDDLPGAVPRGREPRSFAAGAGRGHRRVSREVRVMPPELERWRREFLEGPAGAEGQEPPGGELIRTGPNRGN